MKTSEPEITVEQVLAERDRKTGEWIMTWLVKNMRRRPLHILSVGFPHRQFKSDDRRFEPPIDLNGGEEKRFQFSVRCDEPPGLVTENAFAIFQVSWQAERWRIFVRFRLLVDRDGKPETTTELITTQKVGFSEKDFI